MFADSSPDLQLSLLNGIVKAVNVGAVVFDAEQRVVLWNKWMVQHSQHPASAVIGRPFAELFPDLVGGRLHGAIIGALADNFPAVLSQTLNKSPLPLYANATHAANQLRMQQAIQVIPIEVTALPRHCVVQIMDVSLAVTREKLLREQTLVLRTQTFSDGLTGIANRRHFDEHAEKELRRAKRSGLPLSLIMIDLDYFKSYNDNYGHLRGDLCLIKVAHTLSTTLRRSADLVARYGGEEFAVVLPETNARGALKMAESMRARIAALALQHGYSDSADHVTISIGVTTQIPTGQTDVQTLIGTADRALYQAKWSGRNCVVVDNGDAEVGAVQSTAGS